MTTKNYSGILRQLSFPERYDFAADSGEHIEDVRFKGEIPLETNIEITLDQNNVIIDWYRLAAPAAEYDGELAFTLGQTRKHIAMFLVRPVGAEITSTFSQDRIDGFVRRMQNVVREFSGGKWDVEVRGYAIEGTVISSVVQLNRAWYRNWLAENDPDFNPTYIGVRSGAPSGMCGNAWIGGNVFYTALGCPFETDVHEFGHAMGLHHAGWGNAEYGDLIPAFMGSHSRRDMHTATQLHRVELLEDEHIYVMSSPESKRFFLVDYKAHAGAVKHGGVREHKLVYINKRDSDKEHFAISFTKGQVWVHRPDPPHAGFSDGYSKTWGVARLRNIGDSATFGVSPATVKFVAGDFGSAEIIVKYDADLPDPSHVAPPHYIIPDTAPIRTGLYNNPEWNHQGLPLFVKDEDYIAGAWYLYDTNGDPTWVQFQGPIVDGVGRLELRTTDRNRNIKLDGTALLYFVDDKHGWFKYQSLRFGRGAIPLTRSATLSDSPLTGFYAFRDKVYEGVSVLDAITEKGDRIVVVLHYTYTPGVGKKVTWRFYDGPDPDRLTGLNIFGGYPNIAADTTLEVIGEARIFEDEFRYLLTGGSVVKEALSKMV